MQASALRQRLLNVEAENIFVETVAMISKICKSKKHKDPLSDILCECNRAYRIVAQSGLSNTEVSHAGPDDHK